jgi:hypothetical protein
MRRHVLVLPREAVALAGAVRRTVTAVWLPEVGVQAVLQTASGRTVGEEDGGRQGARQHACAGTVVSVVQVGTVYYADGRADVPIERRVLGAPRHAAPGRVVRVGAGRALGEAAH